MESSTNISTVSEECLSLVRTDHMVTTVTSQEKDEKMGLSTLFSEVEVTVYPDQGHSQNSLPVQHSSTFSHVGGRVSNTVDHFLQVEPEVLSVVPSDVMINGMDPIVSGGVVQEHFLLSPTSGKMEKVELEALPESEQNFFSYAGAVADVGSGACDENVWSGSVCQQIVGLTSSTTTSDVASEHDDLSNHYDDCHKNLHNIVNQDTLHEDMEDSEAVVKDEYVVSINDNIDSNIKQIRDNLTITLRDCLTASHKFSCDKCSKTFKHVTELSKHVNTFHGKRKRGRPSRKQSTEMYTSNLPCDTQNLLTDSNPLKDVEVKDLYEILLKLRDITTEMDEATILRKMDLSTLTEIFHLASKLAKLSDKLLEIYNTGKLNNADSNIILPICSPFDNDESPNVNIHHHGLDEVASSIKHEIIDNDSDYEFEGDLPQPETNEDHEYIDNDPDYEFEGDLPQPEANEDHEIIDNDPDYEFEGDLPQPGGNEDSWCRRSTRNRVVSTKLKSVHDSLHNDTQLETCKSVTAKPPEGYACVICQHGFVLEKELSHHLLLKHNIDDRPYKCHKCDRAFKHRGRLIQHQTRVHHDCEIPSEIRNTTLIPSLNSVKNEEGQHVSESPSQQVSESRSQHVSESPSQHVSESSSQMTSDNNSNAYPQSLTENHLEIENDDKNNADSQTLTENKLEIEKNNTSNNKDINIGTVCKICKQVFSSNRNLRRHIMTHYDDRPYNCHVCRGTFKRRDHLVNHLRMKHPGHKIQKEFGSKFMKFGSLQQYDNEHNQDKTDVHSNQDKTDVHSNQDKTDVHSDKTDVHSDKTDVHSNHDNTDVHSEETQDERKATTHECHVCLKSFAKRRGLTCHMKAHHNDERKVKAHKCHVCLKSFVKRRGLTYHMKARHKIDTNEYRPYDCEECDKSFMKREHLVKHLASKHPGCRIQSEWRTQFECKVCHTTYQRIDRLVRHMKIKHPGVEIEMVGQRLFECDICLRHFARAENVTIHKKSQHGGDNTLQCTRCFHRAKDLNSLMQHCKQYHPPDVLFKCRHCRNKYSTQLALETHMKTHVLRYCTHCDFVCHSEFDYNEHLVTHNAFTCEQCPDFKTNDNREYRRHLRTHQEKTQLCCELCGYSCNSQRALSYHQVRHVNRTPFKCTECNYSCSSRASFRYHKLKHAGLKPYLCSYCGISYRRTSDLKLHTLTHLGKKPHKCKWCSYSTTTTHNLKEHEMTHTGEKRFQCSHCGFACRRRKALEHHMKVKHKLSVTKNIPLTDDQQSPITQQGSSSTSSKVEPSATLSSQSVPS